ncbi:hypothetical protein [Aliarcobacter butzleri]|uniref:hypothetical protein n=1 Tax=Aliarcobacter butzleri TaxID=28197 RepID=UPI001D18239B|nr:hypothetical protein [Aliarcobacter butzleri]
MNNTSIEYIFDFKTSLDPYNGLTIQSEDLPKTKEEFETNLAYLIDEVKNKRNLIWIYIDIKNHHLFQLLQILVLLFTLVTVIIYF